MDINSLQQTPAGLEQMFNSNVSNGGGSIAATPSLQGLLASMQNSDQMTQQNQQRALTQQTALDPLEQARMNLGNDTMQAQLPGIQAASSTAVRNNANADVLNNQTLKNLAGKMSSEELQRHVDDTANMGTLFSQAGALASSNPTPGYSQRAKAMLQAEGHGDMWNPDWDNESAVPPGQLSDELGKAGSAIQSTSAKLNSLLQVQGLKNSGIDSRAQIAAEASKYNSDNRLTQARELFKNKLQLGQIPKNWQDYAAKMQQFADQEEDPSRKAQYQAEAANAAQQAHQLASAAAGVNTGAKVDTGKLGIPNMADGANPPYTPPSVGAPPVAKPPASSAPAGAVQMLKDNPALAAQYDAKYGAGSASKVLGK